MFLIVFLVTNYYTYNIWYIHTDIWYLQIFFTIENISIGKYKPAYKIIGIYRDVYDGGRHLRLTETVLLYQQVSTECYCCFRCTCKDNPMVIAGMRL